MKDNKFTITVNDAKMEINGVTVEDLVKQLNTISKKLEEQTDHQKCVDHYRDELEYAVEMLKPFIETDGISSDRKETMLESIVENVQLYQIDCGYDFGEYPDIFFTIDFSRFSNFVTLKIIVEDYDKTEIEHSFYKKGG